MQTTTHALIALTGFQRKSIPRSGWAAVIGSVLPDAFIAVFIPVTFARGISAQQAFDVEFFNEPWATIGAISNSFPLWSLVLVAGVILRSRNPQAGKLVTVGALSGLAHLVVDFFTHATDAHRHLWPISNWRFESPFSYWEVEHHANFVMPIEGAIGLVAVKLLWPRTTSKLQRIGLVLVGVVAVGLLVSPIVRLADS